ncbi:MAG: sulfurtransferase TusA family protein [Myxococcota bacterium]
MTEPDREIDLRGEVCPITFARTKLALEEMPRGQVLRVLVDHPESVDSVPRTLEAQGQDVLEVAEVEPGLWAIVVEKTRDG